MKKLISLYKKYEEIVNYVIVGFLTTVVSLAVYYLCVFTVLDASVSWQLQIANILSWVISVTFAFFTNRKFVFKSKSNKIGQEGIKFYASRLLTLILDMLFMGITVSILKMNDKIMKIVSNVIVLILNYILSKIFVFIKKDDEVK